jgi:hypothetical protein
MIYSKKIDFWFIQFPILFPLVYATILFKVPNLENYLIFFTILLFAEPHFGATWTIFFYKKNYNFFKENKHIFYTGSVLIILFSILGFFLFQNIFFLIFFAFNLFHVTRQSLGVCKIYNNNNKNINFQKNLIYFFNLIFFLIGIFRFYIPLIDEEKAFILSITIAFSLIIFSLYELIIYKSVKNTLTTLTGATIFFPICFVSNPIHAILLGVTMHYSQYIMVTAKVYFGRKNLLNFLKKENVINIFKTRFFITILFYGIIMAIFSASGKADISLIKNLILIPIIGQMLHFYLDGFLWKFSESHNRDATLKHLKELIV